MQEALDESYTRLGRYLNPDIKVSPIRMGGRYSYVPYTGRCVRTGLVGPVIDHLKSEVGAVPTHLKMLWMIAYQVRVNRSDGKVKPHRLTKHCIIAFLRREILSTVEFTASIPGLQVVGKTKDIIQRVLGEERYLLLGYGENVDRVLGNGLRYSCGSNLEVNGEIRIAGLDISNETVDFTVPLRLAALKLDWDTMGRYCDLRNRRSLSDKEHVEMLELKENFGKHARLMMRLSQQVSQQDIRIGKWLSQ